MRRLHVIITLIGFLIILQMVGMLLLGLLMYQATPNHVLARQTYIGKISSALTLVRSIDRMQNFLYRGAKPEAPLPQYQLNIDPEDLADLEAALPTEIHSPWYGNLFLTDENKVWAKAQFIADGTTYDVKVRVRGDVFNHWAYRKKSWRVKFAKDQLFSGMREMNLIIPEDRNWYAEHLNANRAQRLGLLHPPMKFVQVSVDGSQPLLYTQIEHWTKEMFEKLGRTGDANVYKTGGGDSYFQQWDPVFEEIGYWDTYLQNPSGQGYEEVEHLLELAQEDAYLEPDYLERLEAVMDTNKLVSWYVLGLLSGSRHITDFNLRLFFDPSLGKFEPIPWDVSLYAPHTLLYKPNNVLLNQVFQVPALKLAAHNKVWEYINDPEQIAADLEFVEQHHNLIERAAYRDPLKLQSNRQVKTALYKVQRNVQWNFDFLADELKRSEVLINERLPIQTDVLRTFDLTARGVAFGRLHELALPVEFSGAIVSGDLELWRDDGDGEWGEEDELIGLTLRDTADKQGRAIAVVDPESDAALLWTEHPPTKPNGEVITAPHTTHRYFVVSDDLEVDDLEVELDIRNAVTGKKATVIGQSLVDERTFERLPEAYATRSEFLQNYPAFRAEGEDTVVLRGQPVFSETVIIPAGLKVEVRPGAVIRLRPGVSILSYSPVEIVGLPNLPVQIYGTRSADPWGVFAVLNAEGPSTVQWLEISGGGEDYINGTFFSGMLAFHASPVTISDTIISDATGDDGLNLKYVYVDLNRVRFEDNAYDGLDVDMALSGIIDNSVFINNGNDGLDISGSPIVIRNVAISGSGDKCLSVGERSTPLIYDTTFSNCYYGIAVKDDSHAKLERVNFEGNNIAIGAYVKKLFFGPPSVEVKESSFENNTIEQQALSGAVITID